MALDGLYAYLIQTLDKEVTVLSVHDGLNLSTKYLYLIFFQNTVLLQGYTAVKCGLATESEQDCIGTLLSDNLLYKERGYGVEINPVGNTLTGLYGCDVRVDQNGLTILLLEGLEGLGSGVIELTCFTNLECA